MRLKIATLLLGGSMCLATAAFGQSADDRKWVAQCLSDNADAR